MRSSLDCNAIGDEDPPPDYTVALGRVALPAAATFGTLQAARQGDGRWFAKTGLGIRAGTEWRLLVPRAARGPLLIGWGSPGVPRRVVSPPPCDIPSTSGWLWFPGGFFVSRRGCYPVVVVAAGRRETLPIAVGAPCPG